MNRYRERRAMGPILEAPRQSSRLVSITDTPRWAGEPTVARQGWREQLWPDESSTKASC